MAAGARSADDVRAEHQAAVDSLNPLQWRAVMRMIEACAMGMVLPEAAIARRLERIFAAEAAA